MFHVKNEYSVQCSLCMVCGQVKMIHSHKHVPQELVQKRVRVSTSQKVPNLPP